MRLLRYDYSFNYFIITIINNCFLFSIHSLQMFRVFCGTFTVQVCHKITHTEGETNYDFNTQKQNEKMDLLKK